MNKQNKTIKKKMKKPTRKQSAKITVKLFGEVIRRLANE